MDFLKKYLAKRRGYFIKPGYAPRLIPEYYFVAPDAQRGRVYQPFVYPLAFSLARRAGCTTLIDIGSGNGEKLIAAHPEFKIIGMDFGANLEACQQNYPFGEWREWDIDHNPAPSIPLPVLKNAVLICSDVIEHLADPSKLLLTLKHWLNFVPYAIVSTPDRDLVRGVDDLGPPGNTAHLREWNKQELNKLFDHFGLCTDFIGHTMNNSVSLEKKTIVAVLRQNGVRAQRVQKAPQTFRVLASLTASNEEDSPRPIVSHLIKQGLEVHVKRLEPLSSEIAADWCLHVEAEEIPCSPWMGCSLREAIYRVDQEGYHAIEFTVINVYPTQATGAPDQQNTDNGVEHFDFEKRPSHGVQLRAWKKQPQGGDLSSRGGHEVHSEGRKVYPYKFLIKRYPEGCSHAPIRVDPPGHPCACPPDSLQKFDQAFYATYLVELISGVGIAMDPE